MPAPTSRLSHAALAVICLGTAPLGATHYVISALDDSVATNSVCSLREALLAAATDSPQDTCPAGSADDLVTLPEGVLIWDRC